MIRLGVDVGGTNTDAVLISGDQILETTKQRTTEDILSGVTTAIAHVLATSELDHTQIDFCMIGTTQFTNAFVQRRALNSVAIIRLGLPAAAALPPLTGWPEELKASFSHQIFTLPGGHHFDGRVNSQLDLSQLEAVLEQIQQGGFSAVAICSVFSPMNSEFELQVAERLKQLCPSLSVSLSHQVGRVGLIERENSTIMNASLATLADKVVSAFEQALVSLEISAPLYITQNDGTLMNAEQVRQYPVMTFASGPTNSMRGAALLSGVDKAIVADIGGTTTDIGWLQNGFPRESSINTDIGGVRTNFRMPDIIAVGLGGGSIIHSEQDFSIGPQSVGYQLLEQAKSFGGNTLTATDIAVQQNWCEIPEANSQAVNLSSQQLTLIESKIDDLISQGLDHIRTNNDPVPLILVGGGHFLLQRPPEGISELLRPAYAEVANAVGASIGQVSGEIDQVFDYQPLGREKTLERAKNQAIVRAIAAGALPNTVSILDIQELPLGYVSGQATRVKIKATGQLF